MFEKVAGVTTDLEKIQEKWNSDVLNAALRLWWLKTLAL